MNPEEAFAYLRKAAVFGSRPGLERINGLLEGLGHPERDFAAIHVAGTNGKGTVTAAMAAVAAAAGHRTGVYTSPYLERFSERIRVLEGRVGLERLEANETEGEISDPDFACAMTAVAEAADRHVRAGGEPPTEFELLTAAAFLHFSRERCPLVIVETGLGGRLDATNAIPPPLCAVITALGMDHTDVLGKTLAEIAFEKAGILKAGSRMVLLDPAAAADAEEAAAARAVVEGRCAALGIPFRLVSQSQVRLLSTGLSGLGTGRPGQRFRVDLSGLGLPGFDDPVFETGFLAPYQPLNLACALAACRVVAQVLDLDEASCREGIRRVRWPGRFELLRQNPPMILDGGHNPQGARQLGLGLSRLLPDAGWHLVVGILADKDVDGMLGALADTLEGRIRSIRCTTPDSPRALSADALADRFRRFAIDTPSGYNNTAVASAFDPGIPASARPGFSCRVLAIPRPEAAVLDALAEAASEGGAVCAFGSLYLAGRIRTALHASGPSNGLRDPGAP